VLIALDGNEGKGSGRAPMPFDLHGGLSECRDLLVRFGGHRAAAGVTIDASRVEDFAQRFNDVARSKLSREDLQPELRIDAVISIDEVSDDLEALLRHFEPFGVGNPTPVFLSRNVRLTMERDTYQGETRLQLRIADFRVSDPAPAPESR
jgi:single-stranded-DNA-specific exonuclease